MEIEYNMEVKETEGILIIDVNERVKNAIDRIENDVKLDKINLECLKIDMKSMETLSEDFTGEYGVLADNLIAKIKYIIKTHETVD